MSQLERFKSDLKLATPTVRPWVEKYLKTGSNYPVTLEIDPTNRCPLACGYCIWSDFRADEKSSLKPEVITRVVTQAAEIGVKSMIWTGGGDPLANNATVDGV